MERAEVGKQVEEKGRGSLGGPLLIAAGRGYVPRVIVAECARGPRGPRERDGRDPRTQPPRTAQPVPSSRCGAYAVSIRALSFRVAGG